MSSKPVLMVIIAIFAQETLASITNASYSFVAVSKTSSLARMNHYPQDIEYTAERACSDIRLDAVQHLQ